MLPEVCQAEHCLYALLTSQTSTYNMMEVRKTSNALIKESRSSISAETISAPSAARAFAPLPLALRVRPRTVLDVISEGVDVFWSGNLPSGLQTSTSYSTALRPRRAKYSNCSSHVCAVDMPGSRWSTALSTAVSMVIFIPLAWYLLTERSSSRCSYMSSNGLSHVSMGHSRVLLLQ